MFSGGSRRKQACLSRLVHANLCGEWGCPAKGRPAMVSVYLGHLKGRLVCKASLIGPTQIQESYG